MAYFACTPPQYSINIMNFSVSSRRLREKNKLDWEGFLPQPHRKADFLDNDWLRQRDSAEKQSFQLIRLGS